MEQAADGMTGKLWGGYEGRIRKRGQNVMRWIEENEMVARETR